MSNHSEYAGRMHRVLEHIDRHLDESVELADVASVANFSAFHFHRLFSAWMGETFGDYLRRRRLEMGALRLIARPKASVMQIALSVGFTAPEAFARAFKARFGATPTAWRASEAAKRKTGQTNSNSSQEINESSRHSPASPKREALMKVRIVDRQPTHVAYLRYIGPYGRPVSEFWQRVVAPWMATNNLFGRPRFGISHDDPAITAPEKCRYDACVEIPANFAGTGDFHTTTIPGGKYAAGAFEGTVDQIEAAWAELLRDWLPQSGMELDGRPLFEYYPTDARFDPKTGVLTCDLCVPVV